MKKHIYLLPGTAANSKIFDRIELPKECFELHFLEWVLPTDKNESLEAYAGRMCQKIQHAKPILLGVSFGGILVQEMSKQIECEKIVLVSSIKNKGELSFFLNCIRVTKIYQLFPSRFLFQIEKILSRLFGPKADKKIMVYRTYLSYRNPTYLKWAIHNALCWSQRESLSNTLHIHGNKDPIFPLHCIKNCEVVKNGSHIMILTKAKEICKILVQNL